jgi:site-specific DNA-adenine methylase
MSVILCPNCDKSVYHKSHACEHCRFDFLEHALPRRPADERLRPPFPFFGAKRKVAHDVWRIFGNVSRYIEPFLGSAAMALARPRPIHSIVNDKNAFISNFWRAIQYGPKETARWADWPVNETDLIARKKWLESRSFVELVDTPADEDLVYRLVHLSTGLKSDPLWFDPKIAAFWVYGQCCGIRCGWCTGNTKQQALLPAVNPGGIYSRGFHRTLAGDARTVSFMHCFRKLQVRMRDVIVACGHWERVVTPAFLGERDCAIFLDPPYSVGFGLYGRYGDGQIARRVRDWAAEWGKHSKLKIALCGYDGDHNMPAGWSCYRWDAGRGFSKDPNAGKRERIWFSPACNTFSRLSDLIRV